MFGTALIVFREVLEAALHRRHRCGGDTGIPGRVRCIVGGLAAGLMGSVARRVRRGADRQLAEGMGQELFNASILGIAVAMLAWHNIWMSVHGRELAANAKKMGKRRDRAAPTRCRCCSW